MTRSLICCATLLFASLARADTEETWGLPPLAPATAQAKDAAPECTETFGIPLPVRGDRFLGELRREVLAQQVCIDGSCAVAAPTQFVNPVQRQQTFGVVQQAIAAPAPVVVQQPVVQQAAPAERVVAQIVERTRYEEVVEQREVIVRRPVKELVEVPVPQPPPQAAPCPCPQPVYYQQQQCAQPVYYQQQQQAYYQQQQYFQQQYRQAPRQQQQLSGTARHLMGPPHYFTYEQVAGRQEWELEQMHTQHHAELDARGGGRAFANGNGPARRFAGRIRERISNRRGG